MKHYFFLLISIFLSLNTKGQISNNRPYFSVAYFGVLGTHPGIRIGIQQPLANLNELQTNVRQNQIVGGLNLFFYFHRRNHIGLGMQAEIGYQRRHISGTNFGVFLGVGYLQSHLANKIYAFDSDGNPASRTKRVQNHFIKTASLAIGKGTQQDLEGPFWLIRPTLMQIKPYNIASSLNFIIDGGYFFK